jgi:hypothetical protein
VIDDCVTAIREFELKSFPATIAFRGNRQIEFEKIEDMASPLFARLERDDLKTICYQNCFVYFRRPTNDQFTKFEAFTDIPGQRLDHHFWTPNRIRRGQYLAEI